MKTSGSVIFVIFLLTLSMCIQGNTLVKRHILALYNSKGELGDQGLPRIHLYGEAPLNYLGYVVDHWDIQNGLPSLDKMTKYTAVFTWFNGNSIPNAFDYVTWLNQVVDKDIKLVVWGNFGFYVDAHTGKDISITHINKFLKKIGLRSSGVWEQNIGNIKVDYVDSSMMAFEKKIDTWNLSFHDIQKNDNSYTIYMSASLKNRRSVKSHLALVSSKYGGFVFGNTILFKELYPQYHRKVPIVRWRLNPFLFFSKLFGDDEPVFDTAMLQGLRILYTQVGGKGIWESSEVDRKRHCIEILKDSILNRFPLPTSLSFISNTVDERFYGNKKVERKVLDIIKLPFVEVASNTFSAPQVWRSEQLNYYSSLRDKNSLPLENDRFNGAFEVEESMYYLKKLTKKVGKKVSLFFWTGDNLPNQGALEGTDKHQIQNINGGKSRFDRKENSYAHLAPLGRKVGNELQIYSTNVNDLAYTDQWVRYYSGYQKVIETFERTKDIPFIRPMNINFNYVSLSKYAGYKSLQKVYTYVMNQKCIPIFTSDYCDIVDGFFKGEIYRLNREKWKIKNYGASRTIRFTDTTVVPDMQESINILGYKKNAHNLYIFLNEGDEATIKLINSKPKQMSFSLIECNSKIINLQVSEHHVNYEFTQGQNNYFLFRNFPKNAQVSLKNGGTVSQSITEKGYQLIKIEGNTIGIKQNLVVTVQ